MPHILLKDELEIRLGETRVTKDFNVDLIVVHPEYSKHTRNDIALVRLAEDADLSVYTPACLPTTNQDFTGQLATVAGWGKTEAWGANANILQDLEGIKVLSDDQCRDQSSNDYYDYIANISPDMVCAGGEEGKDSCFGDSGGPLIVQEEDNTFTLVGVVSFGLFGCALEGAPGVYAEVSSEWKYFMVLVLRKV